MLLLSHSMEKGDDVRNECAAGNSLKLNILKNIKDKYLPVSLRNQLKILPMQ